MRAAKRLRLDGPASRLLHTIIENHLLMAGVSQRRDLDDPAVIRQFARQIQTPETLDLLTLLTFADSQGTSDKLWNGFKDLLLWQLHDRAMALLTGGTEFVRASQMQRESVLQAVRELAPKQISSEELNAHFAALPQRYFEIHTAKDIGNDLELTHRFMRRQILEDDRVLSPATAWQDEPDRGYNLVKVCTWDRAGLFSKIAGSFSAVGLNILSAQIFTRSDGIVLDKFFVNDAKTGNLAPRERQDKFTALLGKVLNDEDIDLSALIAREINRQPAYSAYAGERLVTQIYFDNGGASDTRTLIEIETEDRLGLLYAISQALAGLALDISTARIVTERGAAIDSFYVRELDGGKIVSPERRVLIENCLREAISRLDAVA
jgi:[protein-PII] uridylyltransferase